MQVSNPLNIPFDCLNPILNKIHSNILLRLYEVSKQWHSILELEWEKRSQQIPQLSQKNSGTWKEHYFLNINGSRSRQLEKENNFKLFTALGTSFFVIEPDNRVSSFKTDHKSAINVVKSVYSERVLLTGSSDKTIQIWGISSTGDIFPSSTLHGQDSPVTALQMIENTNIVSGGSTGKLYYWVQEGPGHHKHKLHRVIDKVHSATIVFLGYYTNQSRRKYVFSGASDGTIGLSKLSEGKFQHLKTMRGHKHAISGMGVISGRPLLVTGSESESAIKIWKLQPNKRNLVFSHIIRNAHPGGVTDIKVDYNCFFSCGKDGTLKKWHVLSENKVNNFSVKQLAYTPLNLGDLKRCTYLTEGNKIIIEKGTTTELVIKEPDDKVSQVS